MGTTSILRHALARSLVVAVALGVGAWGCEPPADPAPADGTGDEHGTTIAFGIVTKFARPDDVGRTRTRRVFRTADEFRRFFGTEPPASVDFPREWAAFYSAGAQATTGFHASITRIRVNAAGTALLVTTRLSSPGDGCRTTPASEVPSVLVAFDAPRAHPRDERFSRDDDTLACPATDAGMDVPVTPDVPPTDVGSDGAVPPGCNPASGVECDGDWTGRCATACAADQCCSPQSGAFACVARDAMGHCPAADIWVDATQIPASTSLEWRNFAPGSCAIVEGCVAAPGWRRLLRFSTFTPNTGGADLYLGVPTDPRNAGLFEYSPCHGHYHFNSYAEYALTLGDGAVAARGHKQAFCLLDLAPYSPTAGAGTYSCANQGISRGWQDIYGSGLDCQWVDVTDVAPGSYLLNVSLNTQHVLNESNYTNNTASVPVTITPSVSPGDDAGVVDAGPPGSPTAACPASTPGPTRECGWSLEGTHACAPGATVDVGCSTGCGFGSCTGDTVLRVCPGTGDCSNATAVGSNDDAPCGSTGFCNTTTPGVECCSYTQVVCPATGQITVLTGAYNSADTAACTVVVR